MKKLFLCLLLFSCLTRQQGAFAQVDSLLNVLQATGQDTHRVHLLQEIAYTYLYSDRQQAQAYTDSAAALSEQLDFPTGIRHSMYLSTAIANFDGAVERAEQLGLAALDRARADNDKATQARVLNTLCQVYTAQFRLPEALDAILESAELCRELGDKRREAVATYTTSTVYQYLEEIDIARSYLFKALAMFEELDDAYLQGVAYQGLAVLSTGQEAYEHAQKSYEMLQQTHDVMGVGMALWTMGDAQQEMGKPQAALPHYEQALAIFKEIDFPEGMGNVYSNIGSIKARSSAFNEAPAYLSAAEEIARAAPYDDVLRASFQGWAYYYAQTGDAQRSIQYMDSVKILNDTLYRREQSEALLEAEARLKTKEKEAELYESQLAVQRQESTISRLLLIGSLVLAGGLVLFLVLRDRQRRREQATRLDLELERQKSLQLAELDQLKSNFFANISHEFRTPLTVIMGPLQEMLDGTFKANYKAYYELMLRNARRLQALINQLLDLSKLESSKMESNPVPGDIHLFTRQVAAALESWAYQRAIDYRIQVAEEPLWLAFDHDQLEKILTNLLSNAIKFTPAGGQIVVGLESQEREGTVQLELTVSDTGTGIPRDELPHIFERFYQSRQQTDGMASSGIGLALTKELVDFMGGKIWAENQADGGTRFTVALSFERTSPIATEADAALLTHLLTNDDGAQRMEAHLPNSLDAPLILLVEDNRDVRRYIKDQLKDDYQILEAEHGKLGLEMAQRHVPDLIVSDVMMPEMDGYTLAQKLRADERTSHIPIIMLTAKAEQADKLEGLATGVDSYLIKPFDPQELRLRTQNLIEQRRQLQQHYTQKGSFFQLAEEHSSMDEQFLTRFRELIMEQIDDEQLSVQSLSEQMNLSRSQLHRKLKALTGISPTVWMRKIRLEQAWQMLHQQTANVSEVAFAVGFSNLSYFAKCFREEYGLAPSDMLK